MLHARCLPLMLHAHATRSILHQRLVEIALLGLSLPSTQSQSLLYACVILRVSPGARAAMTVLEMLPLVSTVPITPRCSPILPPAIIHSGGGPYTESKKWQKISPLLGVELGAASPDQPLLSLHTLVPDWYVEGEAEGTPWIVL